MPPQEEGRTLWVGSLSPRLREGDVSELFSRYGPVEYVACGEPPLDSDMFAFVHFACAADAEAAWADLHGKRVVGITGSRPFRIEYSNKGWDRRLGRASGAPSRPQWQLAPQQRPAPAPSGAASSSPRSKGGCTMWVGGLALDATEEDVWDELSLYGVVTGVDLRSTVLGTTQFALVGFAREEEAQEAVAQLDGARELGIRRRPGAQSGYGEA